MNSTVILLVILVMMSFLFYNNQQENFVQVQTNHNINKNASMIKPVQVTPGYNQTVKIYDRDDPVSNPKYSPNIIPNLIGSSANLNLPGQSNGSFEQSDNKNNKNYKQSSEKILSPTSLNTNSKAIRPESGHLIRPIELDSASSVDTQVEKPYLTKKTPQAYSEFLDYADVPSQEPSDYEANQYLPPINQKMEISNIMLKSVDTENEKKQYKGNLSNEDIVKKLIKKASKLTLSSTSNINSMSSMKKANYAIGYLNMLKEIISVSEIQNFANIDLYKFSEELEKIQKINVEKMALKCTNTSADKNYLLEIATKL